MTGATLTQRYDCVIGIEVHLQLKTRSKLFCRCPTTFGARPNTQVCPVCTGQPGVLPVLNPEAVRLALRFGRAVGATVHETSTFARKNYFYPDLPKGYQISQYERPILTSGRIPYFTPQGPLELELERGHLEEDAGKSLHPEFAGGGGTRIDLNRAGIPLLEIVSEPMIRDPMHASLALQRIRQLAVYLGICDGSMEQGSLRCDANISVRPKGQEALNPKTEIKNLNSFRHVDHALRWEWDRQARLLEDGESLEQSTRLWDEKENKTSLMRTKEDAEDYRYFPEPDLPALSLSGFPADPEVLELPWDKERAYENEGVNAEDARTLAGEPELAEYYERLVGCTRDAKAGANWVLSEVLRFVKELGQSPLSLKATPEAVGRLLELLKQGAITRLAAKEVMSVMATSGESAEVIILREGLGVVKNRKELSKLIKDIVDGHPGQVATYMAGKTSLVQFFVGQLMRATRGTVEPLEARRLIGEYLEGMRKP